MFINFEASAAHCYQCALNNTQWVTFPLLEHIKSTPLTLKPLASFEQRNGKHAPFADCTTAYS
jgi:hypothetical protein